MSASSTPFLDTTHLPIARLRAMPADLAQTQAWLADMAQLMAAQTPFALVYDPMPHERPGADAHESRKTTILWLKQNREAFQTWCKGMVVTCQPDQSDRDFLQANQTPLSKAYGVPVLLASNAADANAQALALAA